MDLKEFVAETLKQVIDGVKEAQSHASQNGAMVAPGLFYSNVNEPMEKSKLQDVAFDVAVTAQKSNEEEGKVGLKIPYFNIGGRVSEGQENATVSRIQFNVEIMLPLQK